MRNFIFKQVFLLSLTFFYAFSVKAQTATSPTCSSVTVSNLPNYDINLYLISNTKVSGNTCTKLVILRTLTIEPRYNLERKVNGAWTSVVSNSSSPTFTGLASGFFRVTVQLPTVLNASSSGCPGGKICVINNAGQQIGFIGFFGNLLTSNEIFVGATQPNDIQFTFVDNNSNSNNLAWDANEAKVINTSGTKAGTYDRYWLAIIEQSSPNRFKSQGWTFAQMPTTIDIEQIWKQSFPGGFNSLGSYYVQLAAMNGCNTSGWVEANNSQGSRTFFVCPPGSGCREMGKEETIVISPNPTSSSFRLMGMDETSDYSLTLTDISGRTLKTYVNVSNQDLDVADLPTGMYLAQLWNGAKKVQISKLSIVK